MMRNEHPRESRSVRHGTRLSRRAFLQAGIGSVASLLLLAGCERNAAPAPVNSVDTTFSTDSTRESNSLRVGFSAAPAQLDPVTMATTEAFQVAYMVYDSLVRVDRALMPQPMLATEWESSTDGLQWIFQLRQDVTFHHGSPFTAADVVHTLTRLIDPQGGSRLASSLRFIDTVAAVDDSTVRLDLNAPNMDLLLLLGTAQARILAADYAPELLNTQPSGTGPYKVTEILSGDRIRFQRNEAYWDVDQLMLAEVEHRYLPTLDLQAAALATGELDIIPDVGSSFPDVLSGDPAIATVDVTSGAYQTVVMQATEAPFDDVRVRQAIKHCLDRAMLRDHILGGRGVTADDHPVAPVSPFWADLPPQTHDLSRARALLAEAGYPNGFEIDLITSTSRPGMVELAQAVQEMVAPVGIRAHVVLVPPDIYWTDYGGKVPFHIGNWNFRPSIDETFRLAYHSTSTGNESLWSDPQLDVWIDAARAEPDMAQRKQLYAQAQALIMQDGAVAIPYFRPIVSAVRTRVQGYQPHPSGLVDLRGVTLQPPS